MFFQGKMVMEV